MYWRRYQKRSWWNGKGRKIERLKDWEIERFHDFILQVEIIEGFVWSFPIAFKRRRLFRMALEARAGAMLGETEGEWRPIKSGRCLGAKMIWCEANADRYGALHKCWKWMLDMTMILVGCWARAKMREYQMNGTERNETQPNQTSPIVVRMGMYVKTRKRKRKRERESCKWRDVGVDWKDGLLLNDLEIHVTC